MKSKHQFFWLGMMLCLAWAGTNTARAQRQMERLGRGLVVLHSATTQAYMSWRLFGNDPADIGFNVYRSANGGAPVKVNASVITNTTDFLDTTASFTLSNSWYVTPVIGGVEGVASAASGLAANSPVRQYLPLPLQPVTGGLYPPYDVKFCWVGDFDGDGEYDYLVDRLSTTGNVNQYLQAYKRDGTMLWQMDMGYNSTNQYNIEPGASAISTGDKDNVTVYDLDGDGRAEVIVRTARGVVLPDGTTITGPDDTTQYLSVLDGLTGHELARITITNLWPADGPLNGHCAIMYCDGVRPSVVFEGENRNAASVFQRETLAYDYRNGKLTQRWFFTPPANSNLAWGHQVRIADVNHDGIDDLVEVGSAKNGLTGQPLYDTELQHGDRFHTTDIDPDHPGLETFAIQQLNATLLATAFIQAADGKLLKKWYSSGIVDVGRGVALDMDPNHRGCEFFSTQPGIFDCTGKQIYVNSIWPPEALWWDADLSREFIDGPGAGATSPVVNKFDPPSGTSGRLYTIYNDNGGVHQAYGGRPAFFGDILGDWREELVLVANTYAEVRIYVTKLAATNRLYCLMQNPQYRAQCSAKGYYQASYVDYFLGNQMQPPCPPPAVDAKLVWHGDGVNTWDAGSAANWRTNWIYAGNANTNAAAFNSGDSVLFDLTGSNNAAINLNGTLAPGTVTVHSPKNYTIGGSGALSGAMKLVKVGGGKLTLNGTNTFSGATTVWEGSLAVNGSLPLSPVTVRGGVFLDGAISGTGWVGGGVTIYRGGSISPGNGTNSAPGTLTISNGLVEIDGAWNRFKLSDDPSGTTKTNDLLNVIGNLTLTATNNLVITPLNQGLPPGGVYTLINYSGTLAGSISNLAISGLPGIPVALTNPPGRIALVVKGYRPPATVVWTGGGGGNKWDLLASTNWINGAAKDQFAPLDNVRFDNTGAFNLVVNLNGDLNAANVVVDTSSNYVFSGSGDIIGSCGLTKTNTGMLTISNLNNSFTGRTVLAGGTLSVPELDPVGFPSPIGNPPGVSPTNLVLSGGSTFRITGESYTERGLTLGAGTNTLEVYNAADQVTIAGQIVGAGALLKAGAGTLALTVSNGYSGGTFIYNGSISLGSTIGNQYGTGSGLITFSNGTLSMIDIEASENCPWSMNVLTNTVNRLDTDGRCSLSGSLTGGGTLSVFCPYVRTDLNGNWSAFTGKINAITDSDGGNYRINNSAGYPNAKFNLASGMSLHCRVGGTPTISIGELSGAAGSYISAPGGNDGLPVIWRVGGLNTSASYDGFIQNNVGLIKTGSGTWTLTGTNVYTGPTTITNGTLQIGNGGVTGTLGSNNITCNAATLAFNRSDDIDDLGFGTISGTGNLAKRGAGRLTLADAHTYSGVTTIEAGTLALTNAGSIANSLNLNILAGAQLDVSGRTGNSLTLAAGKMISGYGSINGNLTVGPGAILAPGGAIGTLTFSNSLTLANGCTNWFEVSKAPLTNDVANVMGPLTCGGTLIITNLGATALAAGDTFKLFKAASFSGSFGSLILPALPAGLGWNTNAINANGSLSVVITGRPILRLGLPPGSGLAFAGTGGVANASYYLLGSSNLNSPFSNWVRLLTNQFDNGGAFNFTNLMNTNGSQNFYRLQIP